MDRVFTGSRTLDAALAGGFPEGAALLLIGEEGAGATEFALTLLHAAVAVHPERKARFASALRSPARVRAEAHALFGDASVARIDVAALSSDTLDATSLLADLQKGDILVIESAGTIAPPGDGVVLRPFWHHLADAAGARGVVIMLLHAPGTLPAGIEAALAEEADGVLRFSWRDGGPVRRRLLALSKLRGLAPVLDGDQVPLFEVSLERGVGYTVALEHSVV